MLYLKCITSKDLLTEQGTLFNVTWHPGWKGSLGENGYKYIYGEYLRCPPATITTLLIGYTPIQNKKSKLKKKEKENQLETGRKTPKQLRMKERSIWNQIGRKGK